jgi:hypothetical protein
VETTQDIVARLRAAREQRVAAEIAPLVRQAPTTTPNGGTVHVISLADQLAMALREAPSIAPQMAANEAPEMAEGVAPRRRETKTATPKVEKVRAPRVARTTVTLEDVTNCWTALQSAKTVGHIDTIIATYRQLVKDKALLAMLANRKNKDYDPTVYVRQSGEPIAAKDAIDS